MSTDFPYVLKRAKVALIFKKNSKFDYSNYRPISLSSNTEKILEKLMYRRLYTVYCILPITYWIQQYSTSHPLVQYNGENKKSS